MNKKKLYESIMESVSRLIKKAINETMDFNNSNIFNKEDSYYDYDEKGSLIYKNIENKIYNNEPLSEEEFTYYFKVNNGIGGILLNKLSNVEKVSNDILEKIYRYNLKYKINSKNELRKIIENYSEKNPTGSLNWIDTSYITDMSDLFEETNYNGDINEWNTSNVTNMSGMFHCAEKFNHPIINWNVSNVTNMTWMFCGAEKFNQRLDDWDVSNVTNMEQMFCGAEKFNQQLEDWDVSNVTNMSGMFVYAKAFNQPIGNWNVSNVTFMEEMFSYAESFNQNISNWKLNLNVNTYNMFFNCPIKEEYKP